MTEFPVRPDQLADVLKWGASDEIKRVFDAICAEDGRGAAWERYLAWLEGPLLDAAGLMREGQKRRRKRRQIRRVIEDCHRVMERERATAAA